MKFLFIVGLSLKCISSCSHYNININAMEIKKKKVNLCLSMRSNRIRKEETKSEGPSVLWIGGIGNSMLNGKLARNSP